MALHSKWAAEADSGNIAAANRVVRKIMRVVDTLTKTPGGRRLLEQLLESEVSYLRLWAAAKVKEWDAALALLVLARLIYEPLRPSCSAQEEVHISFAAENYLATYFRLRPGDTRALPGLLAERGIALPPDVAERMSK